MGIEEMVLRILAQTRPLLPYMLICAAVTTVVLAVLLKKARGLWAGSPRFRWMSLFLGLRTDECRRLGCAWLKLLLLVLYLVGFQKLNVLHYIMFFAIGVLYAVSFRDMARIPGRLVWLVLETVGLVSCNLICGYIRDLSAGPAFWVLYVMMAIFTTLFGIYLFITEVNDISAGRSADLEHEWERFAENGADD